MYHSLILMIEQSHKYQYVRKNVFVCLRFRPGVQFALVTSLAGFGLLREVGRAGGARTHTAAGGDFIYLFFMLNSR